MVHQIVYIIHFQLKKEVYIYHIQLQVILILFYHLLKNIISISLLSITITTITITTLYYHYHYKLLYSFIRSHNVEISRVYDQDNNDIDKCIESISKHELVVSETKVILLFIMSLCHYLFDLFDLFTFYLKGLDNITYLSIWWKI